MTADGNRERVRRDTCNAARYGDAAEVAGAIWARKQADLNAASASHDYHERTRAMMNADQLAPSAVAIVAKAKLPRGQYAITRPNEMAPVPKGSAVRAVEAALAAGQDCRLYRLADGWRFVGIIEHDTGHFIDERA